MLWSQPNRPPETPPWFWVLLALVPLAVFVGAVLGGLIFAFWRFS